MSFQLDAVFLRDDVDATPRRRRRSRATRPHESPRPARELRRFRDGVPHAQDIVPQEAERRVQGVLPRQKDFAVLARRRPTASAQALMIGALLLLDYMFFEDEGACQFQPWRCVCKFKCCDLYCLGCIFPCSCNCPAKEPEEGAGAPFAVDVVELIEAPAAEVIARAQ